MRRTVLLLAFVMVATLVAVPVAYAANFQCSRVQCIGTPKKDTLRERQGPGKSDVIHGKAGNDKIRADRYGRDTDRLYGEGGADGLNSLDGDGRDYLNGGPGYDACTGDRGDRFSQCEVTFFV